MWHILLNILSTKIDVIYFGHQTQKKDQLTCELVFFLLYSPAASSMHDLRDIAFGSDMRFARWKLQGEYNITAEQSGAISLRALRVISR